MNSCISNNIKVKRKVIDENFKYLHDSVTYDILSFISYRLFATPYAYLYSKLKYKNKILNKKVFKIHKKEGYFLYSNLTLPKLNGYLPSLAVSPKRNFVVTDSSKLSKLSPMLGAIPLPSNLKAGRNFLNCLEKRILQGKCVTVFPELKPSTKYNKISSFQDACFKYPVKFDTPCYCITHTYQQRKHSKKPKIISYIDGPFYANKNLSLSEQELDLKQKIFSAMTEKIKLSNFNQTKRKNKEILNEK